MTRPIKFRAWDFENEIMHYPKIQHDETFVLQLNCSYIGEFNGKKYESIKMILMQFTGLTDRNGKEIYEGDIVIVSGLVSDVFYSERWSAFEVRNTGNTLGFYNNIEVIGNIYQTPNLLKS